MRQGIVSQQHRPMADTQPEEFQGSFSRIEKSALKPIYLLLCPPFIATFLLQELQWSMASLVLKIIALIYYSYEDNT